MLTLPLSLVSCLREGFVVRSFLVLLILVNDEVVELVCFHVIDSSFVLQMELDVAKHLTHVTDFPQHFVYVVGSILETVEFIGVADERVCGFDCD